MSSEYEMWLTYNVETEKFRFPVLPEAVNVKTGSGNKSVNVAGLGEVVIKEDPSAVVISFNCLFPKMPFSGAVTPFPDPKALVKRIDAWKNAEQPVLFTITGTPVNLYCVIESFTYSEKAGDVGTLYYNITLKEYKEVSARQVKVENSKAVIFDSAPARVDNRVQPTTHTVVPGDNLWNIARKYLGSGSRYSEIFELNRDIIKIPSLIYPGQVLKLPS